MVSDTHHPGFIPTLLKTVYRRLPAWIAALLVVAALVRVIGMAMGGLPFWLLVALNGLSSFALAFLAIVIEAAPFLLLGVLASGIIEAFIAREELARWVPSHPLLAVLMGSLIGLFIPVGEVGVIPLARRLIRKGLPIPVVLAAMLAVPVLNPIAIASTLSAFGPGQLFWARIGLTLLIATSTGLLFSALPRPENSLLSAQAVPTLQKIETPIRNNSFKTRLRAALLVSVDEFFEMGRFLVIAAGLAALTQRFVPLSALLEPGPGPVNSVLVMMAQAALLSVGSAMDGFIAQAFTASFSPGSVLAFLVFGPVVDIKNTLLLLRIFKPAAAALLILVPLLLTLTASLVLIYWGIGW